MFVQCPHASGYFKKDSLDISILLLYVFISLDFALMLSCLAISGVEDYEDSRLGGVAKIL